ncbi:hypothetical protein CBER1_08073 [Cercospora berteroae]|uniref:NACHT domain-containing protein n=1 Tax=Cercospora berteroae TaxID=357750 RepID=A0A2S6CF76_9PEZI|nr:hypothetical protein CBER1_08073 [Cercospora berteroae]
MDPGTAVGVASLGIQLCEGILKYYSKWRSYDKDIEDTYRQIAELAKIFARLRASLDKISYDRKQSDHAKEALQPCETSLLELQQLLVELRPINTPSGRGERAWAQLRRTTYPLKASTLAKLRELDEDVRNQLSLALQGTQIDIAAVIQGQLSDMQLSIDGLSTTLNQVSLQSTATATDVNRLGASVNQVSVTADSTAEDAKALLQAEDQKKLNEILKWLTPDASQDPWLDFKAARDKHQAGTGTWLLTDDSYQSWKSARTSHLWVHGKAGSGKTILCSTAVDDLRTDYEHAPSLGFAVFFFSFANQKKQSVDDMLLALIAQLARRPPALVVLAAAYEKHKLSTPFNAPLQKIFIDQINAMKTSVIVLDALDECPQALDAQRKLWDSLQLMALETQTMKLFVTSRDEPPIRIAMSEKIHVGIVSVDVGQVNHDIECYVMSEIEKDATLRKFSPESKLRVPMGILPARRTEEDQNANFGKVEQILSSLPKTLNDTYERMLARIDESDRREAKTVLQWLVVKVRHMTLSELAETCIIDTESKTISEYDRVIPENLVDLLGSLVVREMWYGIPCLTLAHFSVQEYLLSNRIAGGQSDGGSPYINELEAHSFVTDSCLAYLKWYASDSTRWPKTHEDLNDSEYDFVSSDDNQYDFANSYDNLHFPLLSYAKYHMTTLNKRRTEADLAPIICLLSSREKVIRIWGWGGSGCMVAAALNCPQLMCRLRCDATSKDLNKSLHDAARNGNLEVVALLLEAGADSKNAALEDAAEHGHLAIVDFLLGAGAVLRRAGSIGKTALTLAAWGGHNAIVKSLLRAGFDLHTASLEETGLMEAAVRGHDAIVEMLLKAGANYDCTDCFGRAVLMEAAGKGHGAIVEMLLKAGANYDRADKFGRTALMEAAGKGHDAIVETLLKAGAKVNLRNELDETALMRAARGTHRGAVQHLLDHGADMHLVLNKASRDDGASHLMRYLIAKGASPTDVDAENRGQNVLHSLTDDGYDGTPPKREECLDIEGRMRGGRTPLLHAAEMGDSGYVTMLLQRGADITAKTNTGDTSLMLARKQLGEVKFAKKRLATIFALVPRCDLAEIEEKSQYGSTLLHEATHFCQLELFQHLIDRGVDLTSKTAGGYTAPAMARHYIAWCARYEQWVEREKLVDPWSLDDKERSALMKRQDFLEWFVKQQKCLQLIIDWFVERGAPGETSEEEMRAVLISDGGFDGEDDPWKSLSLLQARP